MTGVNLIAETTRADLQDVCEQFSEALEVDDVKLKTHINKLHKLFTTIFQNKLIIGNAKKIVSGNEHEGKKLWFKKKYTEVKKNLLQCFHSEHDDVKSLSLKILMEMIALEVKYPRNSTQDAQFPTSFLQSITQEILSSEKSMKVLTTHFDEFIAFDDIKFYLLKDLSLKIKAIKVKTEPNFIFLQNLFDLIEKIKLNSEEKNNYFCVDDKFEINDEMCIKLYNFVWMEFLKFQLNVALYKKVLIILHDQIIPNLEKPLLLTDFLMESYNKGGVVSLLALSSLFVLIQNYNLEYPDFYKKFYSLISPEIFTARYRGRFYFLTELFLSSTYLPEYLVAAFIKKFARMTLTAQPNTIITICLMLRNVISKHPNLEVLCHNPNGPTDLTSDPFILDEPDPSKCNAVQSSLWEIESLQSHYVPEVVNKAQVLIRRNLLQMDVDISDKYETTIDEVMEEESSKNWKEIPLTFERPKTFLNHDENSLWILK